MNFEIIRADKANFDTRIQIAEIFAEGFTQWLGYFSKDKKVIAKAFAHIFVLDKFYLAIKDEAVAGMAACTDCHTLSVQLDKKELKKHLGFFKGTMAWIFLKKEFMGGIKNPQANTGSIEFVGTAPLFRGKGAASQIIRYIISNTRFDKYLIEEVADTNIPAMSLYKKLGFTEYARKAIPPKRAKKIGINNLVSLEYINKGEQYHA